MTDPKVFCKSCGAQKNVMDHQRSSDPVSSAKKAIKKWPRCKGTCDIQYLAGVDVYAFQRLLEEMRNKDADL